MLIDVFKSILYTILTYFYANPFLFYLNENIIFNVLYSQTNKRKKTCDWSINHHEKKKNRIEFMVWIIIKTEWIIIKIHLFNYKAIILWQWKYQPNHCRYLKWQLFFQINNTCCWLVEFSQTTLITTENKTCSFSLTRISNKWWKWKIEKH